MAVFYVTIIIYYSVQYNDVVKIQTINIRTSTHRLQAITTLPWHMTQAYPETTTYHNISSILLLFHIFALFQIQSMMFVNYVIVKLSHFRSLYFAFVYGMGTLFCVLQETISGASPEHGPTSIDQQTAQPVAINELRTGTKRTTPVHRKQHQATTQTFVCLAAGSQMSPNT
jgi:hypothetical protein